MKARLPVSEPARLEALRTFEILDTPAEVAFDRIAHLASEVLDMPMAAVSFVDHHRQWFKARVGLPVCETSRDISFCAHAVLENDILVVPDATKDRRFADNVQVIGEPHLRFYAGALLYAADRQPIGTLCVLDTRPREMNGRQRKILRDLAAITMDELSFRAQHQTLREQHRAIEERTSTLTAVNQTLHNEILQRKRTEDALRQAKQAAEDANRAKSGFLSRMSHELRTPLNAILGFGQLLELNPLGTQDAFTVQQILKGGRHLLALVDEVLDISRAETGALRLVLGYVDLDQFLQGCVALVARLAEMHGVTCTVKKSRSAPSIRVDEQRLRQIVLNLLSNAIKYNRRGGEVILSSVKTPSKRLRIEVSDTGPGISSEGLARLFVPFERLEHESGEIEGTGLGLVISRRIAEAKDGKVDVRSELGHGSTFWIELPQDAAQPDISAGRIPVADASTLEADGQRNVTLLYIEDNLSNLQVIQMLLGRKRPHWRFLSARDGRGGLEQARQESPDLILLDLQLPGMQGGEVLAELRRAPATRSTPAIVLSADATTQSRERFIADGAAAYVCKPFDLDGLLKLLDQTVR